MRFPQPPKRHPRTTSTACRDRQSELKTRIEPCEKVIAGGKAAPKDLAVALLTRGDAQSAKRDYDKAIATYSDALKSDPDNVRILEGRGIAYERKGQDDLAMADYNAALQKRPNYPAPYNNRGTFICAGARCRARSTISSAAIKYAPIISARPTPIARAS